MWFQEPVDEHFIFHQKSVILHFTLLLRTIPLDIPQVLPELVPGVLGPPADLLHDTDGQFAAQGSGQVIIIVQMTISA